MAEWHFVADGDYPNDHEQVLIYCKIHFIPDHRDEKNYYMGYALAVYSKKHEKFFGEIDDRGIKAWMHLPKKPRRKKVKNG